MGAWPHGDPNAVVRGILATAPYAGASPSVHLPAKKTYVEVALDWIGRHLAWLLHTIFAPIGRSLAGSAGAFALLGYAIALTACVLLAFGVYRLLVAFARRQATQATGPTSERVSLVRSLTAAQWRERAARAAQANDYSGAIAALFSAGLIALDEAAIVTFDAARTPGEYRRLVRAARADLAQPFGDLASRFVRAAYAGVAATADDYRIAERAYALLATPQVHA